jgi:hypothetical protein
MEFLKEQRGAARSRHSFCNSIAVEKYKNTKKVVFFSFYRIYERLLASSLHSLRDSADEQEVDVLRRTQKQGV